LETAQDRTSNRLRDRNTDNRSVAWLACVVYAVALGAFALVTLPAALHKDGATHEIALLLVIGFLLGFAVYHLIVRLYDREGRIYPLFIAGIVVASARLLVIAESQRPNLAILAIMSPTAKTVTAWVLFAVGVILATAITYSLTLWDENVLKATSWLYLGATSSAILLDFGLTILNIHDRLFVPQIFPVVLVVLVQALIIEDADEHYLANQYIEVHAAQEELAIRNKALESLEVQRDDMMSKLAHETRTPLAVISSYAELIGSEMRAENPDDPRARDLDSIAEQVQDIAAIMQTYMSFGRKPGIDPPEPVSLLTIITRNLRAYRHMLGKSGMTLSVQLPSDLPFVEAYSDQVTQVLLNLLKNAAKHSQGHLVQIAASHRDGLVRVDIHDDGVGVPPELVDHIFDRGVTGSPSGAGIGLAVCRDIVGSWGGEVNLAPDQSQGADFYFTIPIYPIEDAG
jgi:signal transduction histidine kinase